MMMINFDDYDIFSNNKTTLKEASKDNSDLENIQYMTDSTLEVINYDKVKTKYANSICLSEEVAKSFDALACFNANNQVFIEFKNGKMKNSKKSVKDKTRDSLLIFCDITNTTISYTRNNIDFILVYNEEESPLTAKDKEELKNLSKDIIRSHIMKQAKSELVRFGLQDFKTLYFKEVHTYNEKEFENYLNRISI